MTESVVFDHRFLAAWVPGVLALVIAILLGVDQSQFDASHSGLMWLQLLSYGLLFLGLFASYRQLVALRSELVALDELESSKGGDPPSDETQPTLVLRRWRAFEQSRKIGSFSETLRADNRREALEATAAFGSAQRFLSSVLIVITVLGTFVGVKGAVPDLSRAVSQSPAVPPLTDAVATPPERSGAIARNSSDQLGSSIDKIGSAFGANLAALLAALTLSSFAFGLHRGRALFLRELERVSERKLYSRIPAGGDLSQIVQAVTALRSTMTGINRVESAIDSLNAHLSTFAGALDSAVNRMGSEVGSALAAHSLERESRIERQLTELVGTVKLTSAALDRTAVAYAGLVKGIEAKELDIRSMAEAVNSAATRLSAIADPVAQAAVSITEAQVVFTNAAKQSEHSLGHQALTAKSILTGALEAMEEGNHAVVTSMQSVIRQNQRAFDSIIEAQKEILERATQQREAIQAIPDALARVEQGLHLSADRTTSAIEANGNFLGRLQQELRAINLAVMDSSNRISAQLAEAGLADRRPGSEPPEGVAS